jgi:hypothetical protein
LKVKTFCATVKGPGSEAVMIRKCADCGKVRRHYARGMCERCWRNWNARERWKTFGPKERDAALARMRAYAKRRRGDSKSK